MSKKEIDGVIVDAKSIVTSLKIIKEVCGDNYNDCDMCPLYADPTGSCSLMELNPDNWKINEENRVWRALL